MTEQAHDQQHVLEGRGARARLAELGIPLLRLMDALTAGDVAARQADGFHPVTAAGAYRWMETTAVLRRGLQSDGWVPTDPRNSPRVTDPTGGLAIVAISGDVRTGLVGAGDPHSARSRGPATGRAIETNEQLGYFDEAAVLADMASDRERGTRTWALLYRRSRRSAESLRAELSRMARMNERGFIGSWSERIILPPLTFAPGIETPRDASPDDDVPFPIVSL